MRDQLSVMLRQSLASGILRIKLSSLRIKLLLLLSKFGFGLFARSLRLNVCLFWKLKCQLRLLDDTSHSEGFDPEFDKVVHLAALRLAVPGTFDENVHNLLHENRFGSLDSLHEDRRNRLQPSYEKVKKSMDHIVARNRRHRLDYDENKEAVDQLVAKCGVQAAIRTTLTRIFQVKSLIENLVGNKKGQEYYMGSARSYDPEASVPDVRTVRALLRETRKEIRSLETSISDREALKISLSIQDLTAGLTALSVLFLVSGYLYNRALLGNFGVEVAKYFSLSDYVAASMDGIEYSLMAAVVGSLGGFLGAHSVSRMSFARAEETGSRRRTTFRLLITGNCCAAIIVYFVEPEAFYRLSAVAIISLSFRPVFWFVYRYFHDKDWTLARFLILSVLMFSLHLYASVQTEIYRIEHKAVSDLKKYDISFKGPVAFNTDTTVLLVANSGHLFLRDTATGKVFITPRSQVQSIAVRNDAFKLKYPKHDSDEGNR